MSIFSYSSVLTYVLVAQKNRFIEMVPLSTHNICLGWEIRKLNLRYALLTKVLHWMEFWLTETNMYVCGAVSLKPD